MRNWPVSLSTVAVLILGLSAIAQTPLIVTSAPPTCLSSLCGRTVIDASVAGEPAPESVRVYFRAGSDGPDYYIEMTKTADGYEAVLPAPLRDTTSITYRVVALGADGARTASEPATVPVTSDCQVAALTPEQTAAAMDTVIGFTDATQTGVPKGFSCAGITKVLGVDQTLSPNNACDEVKLAKSDPCFDAAGVPLIANAGGAPVAGAATAGAGGVGYLGAAALGVGVIAGAVIIENNSGDNNEPVSSSRP
ncbi:MAG: hypothetical protein WC538_21725 [Thermoanaerobaculia bacterium]|jgi:hypothetical protein